MKTIFIFTIFLGLLATACLPLFAQDDTPAPVDNPGTITMSQAHQDSLYVQTIERVGGTLAPKYKDIIEAVGMRLLVIIGLLSSRKIGAIHKKLVPLIVLFLVINGLNAQTISADKVAKSPALKSATVKSISGVPAQAITPATTPASGNIVFSSPNIGISGLDIQKSFNGWEATGTVNASFSYGVGVGEYTTNADSSLDIQPYVTGGAFLAAGVIPQSILTGSFQVGGFLGIWKYNSIAAGYDVLTKKPFIALGASISLTNFKKGLGSTIIKLF